MKLVNIYVLVAAALFSVFPVQAQQVGEKIPVIGYVANNVNSYSREAFHRGLRALGYVEGKNIYIEYRYAHGHTERLADLAAELVRLNVKVLVVSGGSNTALRVMHATTTVPIVFPLVSDPVRDGIVASLARPGGNLTVSVLFHGILLESAWSCSRKPFQNFRLLRFSLIRTIW